ncbi:MAG TPA: alpha/beta fold hydrolase [bacterium]|nr:alpha/beta fold hydrolase [bacterium]
MRVFRDFGYTVIAYDYPGYGESTGKANPTNFRIAAETMADYVRETLGFDPASTVYGGYSLGTAATLISTMHTIPSRVFLLAPFTSDREIARYYAGFDVYRAFARASEIEPIRMAPMLDIPVLVAHGKFDRTVPYEQGRRLFEVFP